MLHYQNRHSEVFQFIWELGPHLPAIFMSETMAMAKSSAYQPAAQAVVRAVL